jgi:hypothetical protein
MAKSPRQLSAHRSSALLPFAVLVNRSLYDCGATIAPLQVALDAVVLLCRQRTGVVPLWRVKHSPSLHCALAMLQQPEGRAPFCGAASKRPFLELAAMEPLQNASLSHERPCTGGGHICARAGGLLRCNFHSIQRGSMHHRVSL